MAIAMRDVTRELDVMGLHYHALGSDSLLTIMTLNHLRLGLVISLSENGEYLDVRTHGYGSIEPSHPAYDNVIELLTRVNAEKKIVKFCIDRSDGEIAARAGIPLEDNSTISRDQIGVTLAFICKVCDEQYVEIQRLLGTRRGGHPPSQSRIVSTPGHRVAGAGTRSSKAGGAHAASPARLAAIGVLLLGLAALLGVIHLFIR